MTKIKENIYCGIAALLILTGIINYAVYDTTKKELIRGETKQSIEKIIQEHPLDKLKLIWCIGKPGKELAYYFYNKDNEKALEGGK